MWACFTLAIIGSLLLRKTISPINQYIEKQILATSTDDNLANIPTTLGKIIDKYELLFETVDDVDAHDFAVSHVHSLRVRTGVGEFSAEKIQDYICQAPSLLISLGLLGTFAGLTGGLGEIQSILAPEISPQEAAGGLSEVVAPMSLAFRTSLLGLVLSLSLSALYQMTGWKNLMTRSEGLITGWLEAIAPIQLQRKLKTPLRKSIDSLNTTVTELPENLSRIVSSSIENAFSDRLDHFFDIYTNLSAEAQRTINSLSSLTTAWHEGSADFLSASELLANSTFALELNSAVKSLVICKSDLVTSSDQLCEKFAVFREDVSSTQLDWKVMMKLAAEELQKSNKLATAIEGQQKEITDLVLTHREGASEIAQASKELRKSRLDLGRDFRSLQSTAVDIHSKFEEEQQSLQANREFIEALSELLSDWKASTSETISLYKLLVEKAKVEVSEALAIQSSRIERHDKKISTMLDRFDLSLGQIENQQSNFASQFYEQTQAMTRLLSEMNSIVIQSPDKEKEG